jgi:Asp/Glu/hydantoin racemase
MSDQIVLVHTIYSLVSLFNQLTSDILPGIKVNHIVDEPLLESIRQRGGLTSSDAARVWDHVKIAEDIHARAVLVTCSTLSPVLDNLRPLTALPLVKIDEAMIEAAMQAGRRLGVLATNSLALDTIQRNLQDCITRSGKDITCEYRLVDQAFPALLNGNFEEHDRTVKKAVLDLIPTVNAVILAQASLARVLDIIPDAERPVPIISSPRLALEQVKKMLYKVGWG